MTDVRTGEDFAAVVESDLDLLKTETADVKAHWPICNEEERRRVLTTLRETENYARGLEEELARTPTPPTSKPPLPQPGEEAEASWGYGGDDWIP